MKMKTANCVRRCRLCASEENFNTFYNIFDDNPELELELKITKLLPVVVMPWDPMPHIVCHECIGKLNSFNDFYETSLKAERFLRTLYPTVPENEFENLDPVVHVMETPILRRNPLRLPPKKRVGVTRRNESPEFIDLLEAPAEAPKKGPEETPNRALNCFIVNHITTRDSVYTCRDCFRTFTKQSSALTHTCVNLEDCEGEVEGVNGSLGKAIPPLKIRLFSIKSGLFVCYLCQKPFEIKTELVEHIKEHLLDGKWESEVGKKYGKQRRRRRSRCQEEQDDSVVTPKKRAVRKRRKKSTGTPRKRGRPKSSGTCKPDACETCSKARDGSTPRETTERMTQCSDIEIEVREPEVEESSATEEAPKDKSGSSETPDEVEEDMIPSTDNLGYAISDIVEDPVEIPTLPGIGDIKSDEVTVLEVINNKTPTNFSACIFCDKIFATREALIAHQNRHLTGYPGLRSHPEEKPDEGTFLCGSCSMSFTSRTSLQEHERFHQVDGDDPWNGRKIRIALGAHQQQESLSPKGRDVITITVTSTEKKIPQIEFI